MHSRLPVSEHHFPVGLVPAFGEIQTAVSCDILQYRTTRIYYGRA